MVSKAFAFLGFLLFLVLLIATHVSARGLLRLPMLTTKTWMPQINSNGVDEAKYGNGYGGYPGGSGGYNNGRRGGYGGYPRRGRGGGCYYGCRRRSYHGRGCARCCSYAVEDVDAQTDHDQPHN
ncbi:glycine-rich protein [Ziziphus jujuba]|uniref:Glycine-rich protein n=2 Tax=Ziziphus jujuba TaxID=326968 RepID=A0A6P3ZPY8_ZIZJJ|nr:glycine-rich protein [Ziziphus jujuba]KAH7533422.1 hypothetical protein FEM48_Zijuj04G0129000 [Ziziphus jujuba var. spinosa]